MISRTAMLLQVVISTCSPMQLPLIFYLSNIAEIEF
jgi:hypothetical protein